MEDILALVGVLIAITLFVGTIKLAFTHPILTFLGLCIIAGGIVHYSGA